MKDLAYQIRRIILEQSFRAGVGHIGSALSIADILASVYGDVLRARSPRDKERDVFILSKGHAALALYAALYCRGWLSKKNLGTYCGDGTCLGVHPEHGLPGIECSTGSLGQGLSMGVGMALALKMKRSKARVFIVISDAEYNEGSLWEAAMFAAHHQLSNICVIADNNGQQAFGYTRDVLNVAPVENIWKAFGWGVYSVDGHDRLAITRTIRKSLKVKNSPHVIIANTQLGYGVSYMQRQIKWHYWPMSDKEYGLALEDIKKVGLKKSHGIGRA
ncbi:MAG: transketolase [Candidatus Omnitrophica bacterium]|nr:transketolase [Candidatus Omnitrophota bacterium]